MKMSKNLKINIFIGLFLTSFVAVSFVLYLYILPKLVASPLVHNIVKKEFFKLTNAQLVIDNPVLKTGFSPNIEFKIDNLEINKDGNKYFDLEDFNIGLSFAKLFNKRIDLKNLKVPYLFIDATNLLKLFPEGEQKETKPCDWSVGFFDSTIKVDKIKILYSENNVNYDVNVDKIALDKTEQRNYLHFASDIIVKKDNRAIKVKIADEHKVYIEKNKLYVNDCILKLNESAINLKALLDKKGNFDVKVFSKNFKVENVIDIVNSNILIPNGSELLAYFSNIKGFFDFDFNLNNKGCNGNVDIKKLTLGLTPIENIPVTVSKGKVKITNKDIFLSDFTGFYENKPFNKITMFGTIKDYMKTFDTNLQADAIVTNDFMLKYLSKMIGYPITVKGYADTRLYVGMKNNIIDMKWLFKVDEDDDILVGGEPLSKYQLKRVLVANMQIKDMLLDLKDLNYIVEIPKDGQKIKKKILELNGKIDFSKGIDFRQIGFDVAEPLPSEFLNMVARCELFKGGNVVGKLKAIDGPKGVKLFGNIKLSKIRVPAQRIYVEEGSLSTNFNAINIKANGRYRRNKYTVDGEFVNNIAFPIIINNLALGIDKIDIGKMLESMNMQGQETSQKADISNDDDAVPTFDMSNLIIKNCTFKMNEGIYKELEIKDLLATMTLNENSVLELKSNKFGFAKGYSGCKVVCDLKNHLYNVKLGVKDVDSNAVAYSLLNIKDEISGKAKGFINLNTDDSLKLNGDIKFEIEDGTIGTVGFLQYVLNLASVFRNPLAMISPATIYDLVNIPKGEFETITGTLIMKDNVVQKINIKSKAPYLSSYIVGRYNLENSDASLRIYTKFCNKNTGICGLLRYLSLSTLANKLPLTSKTMYNLYNAEVKELPEIQEKEENCQIYMTKVEGDVEHNNFISSLNRIK